MSVQSNEELIDSYYGALASGEPDIGRFFSEDVEWHLPRSSPLHGKVRGRAAVVELLAGGGVDEYYQPGTMRFDYRARIVSDEDVVMPFTLRAVTANGHDYENDYCMWFRIRDDLIAEVREYFDTAFLFDLLRPG